MADVRELELDGPLAGEDIPPVFANRIHVSLGTVNSRLAFGADLPNGEVLYHTVLAVPTVDVKAFEEVFQRLFERLAEHEAATAEGQNV